MSLLTIHAQVAWSLFVLSHPAMGEEYVAQPSSTLTPAKRKRLLKIYGPYPAGYTHDDLERLLDVLYGLFSHVYTAAELCQIVVSDPFDQVEPPRRLKLVDFAAWLEAILA